MDKATFRAEFEAMKRNPRYPYAEKLQEIYGVTVPAGAPKHQVEYLYKYLRHEELYKGVAPADLMGAATAKVAELFERFPWLTMKYEAVVAAKKVEKTVISKPETGEYADGTIVFCPRRNKYLCYKGGQIVTRASTVEKTKEIATKKQGLTAFNVITD